METWMLLVVVGVAALAILALLVRRAEPAPRPASAAELYGPLPESEAERSELTDPAASGQVTPGAVTPAAAGSPEAYYEETGVGARGPHHLSGPPPETQRRAEGARTAEEGWHAPDWREDRGEGRRINPLPLVGVGGAAIGLLIFALIRRRFRRRSRIERLQMRAREVRDRARDAASVAGDAASRLGSRAATVPEHLDRRSAGGGLGLALTLALLAAARRIQAERARAAEERRRAEALAAARANGRLKLERARAWAAGLRERADAVRDDQLSGSVPAVAAALGGAALLAIAVTAIRRATRSEFDWSGAVGPDSAPAR